MHISNSLKSVFMVLLLGGIATLETLPPATALPSQGTQLLARRQRLKFRVGVRPSRYRMGGFSRAASCGDQKQLTALVPPPHSQEKVANNETVVDKTAADHPTFFVHLPAVPNGTAQFTLQNEAGTEQLHSVKFNLPSKPGVVGIALPPTARALQVGQKYVWQVAVACDPDDASSNSVVSSWVERVKSPGNQSAGDLAEQGIWQDAVTILAMQRYQNPGDRAAAEDWAALMEDAGLPQFKQAEIVQLVK